MRTPGLWTVSGSGFVICDEQGRFVANTLFTPSLEECRGNATFIVKACNAHDALMKACEAAYRYIQSTGKPGVMHVNTLLREALKLAKEE